MREPPTVKIGPKILLPAIVLLAGLVLTTAVVVITPDHRSELEAAGHDRSSVAAALAERCATRDGRPAF